MKTVSSLVAFLGLGVLGSTAFAQLATLPPDASDPVLGDSNPTILGGGVNASSWNASDLHLYNVSSDATYPVPGNPDAYGRTWSTSQPSEVQNGLSTIQSGGGTIRGIYIGETAGWLNDFGYTYNTSPVTDTTGSSFTVFSNIQSVGTPNVAFGDYVNVNLFPSEESTFDFWLNASDEFDSTKTSPTSDGGVYTLFNPSNSTPYISPGNVMWTTTPIMVSTFDDATQAYVNVPTYLAAFEDERLDSNSDMDYSDLIVGIQLFDINGTPLGGNVPVPEASTYGLVGAAGLLGLAAWRRRKIAVQAPA